RRRTTGASTVEEADLTNSPSSLSLARTVLLSTPSSLASSWTRSFATFLLSRPARDRVGPFSAWGSSLGTHRVPIGFQPAFFVDDSCRTRSGPAVSNHSSELQSRENLVCRLLLEKKKQRV